MRPRRATLTLILAIAAAILPAGCFGPLAKRLADRETYGIVHEKQQELFGREKPFSIEPAVTTLTQTIADRAGFSSDQFTTHSLILSLSDALALAIDNNRDYQDRREQVYLAALHLTTERHRFSPILSGSVSERALRRPGVKPGPLPGTTRPTVERFGTTVADLAVTKLFATGARVTVGFTANFLRYYTGNKPEVQTGALSASVVQPLLQGALPGSTMEPLLQADRDVIYSLRAFERYQCRFIVDRVTQYYRLLQAANTIDNEYHSYQRLIVARERAQALEEAQRLSGFQVDQARQDEFKARDRWLNARTNYALALDQFKIDLGLPPELNVQPDSAELARLQKMDLVELSYDLPTAERLAQQQRLDYQNALDQVEDAERKVKIAENDLLPAVDARADLALADHGNNDPWDMNWKNRRYDVGLDAELPLDRKAERNAYRIALIATEAAHRDAGLLRDKLVAQVRDAYQDVSRARQSYEIQLAGLRLAERRVDNVQMLLIVGRANASVRDQLEAESALRDARNNVTRVLVDYVVARLEFYHAIEALEIDDQGMWNHEASTRS